MTRPHAVCCVYCHGTAFLAWRRPPSTVLLYDTRWWQSQDLETELLHERFPWFLGSPSSVNGEQVQRSVVLESTPCVNVISAGGFHSCLMRGLEGIGGVLETVASCRVLLLCPGGAGGGCKHGGCSDDEAVQLDGQDAGQARRETP